jgi:glycylpeptide N-tetradecanoyltransferase
MSYSVLQNGFDVFNALDLMENKEFLETLKFGIGDGNLQYYLYNWRCPSIPPNKVCLIIYAISLCIATPT